MHVWTRATPPAASGSGNETSPAALSAFTLWLVTLAGEGARPT
jgi:hypothetical protein